RDPHGDDGCGHGHHQALRTERAPIVLFQNFKGHVERAGTALSHGAAPSRQHIGARAQVHAAGAKRGDVPPWAIDGMSSSASSEICFCRTSNVRCGVLASETCRSKKSSLRVPSQSRLTSPRVPIFFLSTI